jgi:hypothetical protein
MKVVRGFPPNFREIIKVFPQARRTDIMFAYGDTIFIPGTGKINEHLMAHEAVHGERQRAIGVEMWWRHYLNNRQFRYEEELLAHRAEYQSMIKNAKNPAFIKGALKMVATRLASSLYGCGGGWEKAAKDILS